MLATNTVSIATNHCTGSKLKEIITTDWSFVNCSGIESWSRIDKNNRLILNTTLEWKWRTNCPKYQCLTVFQTRLNIDVDRLIFSKCVGNMNIKVLPHTKKGVTQWHKYENYWNAHFLYTDAHKICQAYKMLRVFVDKLVNKWWHRLKALAKKHH